MKIINKTPYDIKIENIIVKPGKSFEFIETIFDTNTVYSDLGTVKISTEYLKRSFEKYGNLDAREINYKDKQYLPIIEIFVKDHSCRTCKHNSHSYPEEPCASCGFSNINWEFKNET